MAWTSGDGGWGRHGGVHYLLRGLDDRWIKTAFSVMVRCVLTIRGGLRSAAEDGIMEDMHYIEPAMAAIVSWADKFDEASLSEDDIDLVFDKISSMKNSNMPKERKSGDPHWLVRSKRERIKNVLQTARKVKEYVDGVRQRNTQS